MKILSTILILVAISSSVNADPIRSLVETLSKSHTWWNGSYPKLGLAKEASIEKIIAAYCGATAFQDGSKIREFTLIEQRTVTISGPFPDTYIAALCKTDHGAMIFLLQYRDFTNQWWLKPYNAPAEPASRG